MELIPRAVALAILVLAGAVVAAPNKALGPEWKRRPDDGLGRLWRKLEIDCSRFPAGNATTYRATLLEGTEVVLTETDGGRNASAQIGEAVEVEVSGDGKGKAPAVRVKIGEVIHWDLNADGVFDGLYDGRANRLYIALDGQYVPVEDSKIALNSWGARSLDRAKTYAFDGQRWKVAEGKGK